MKTKFEIPYGNRFNYPYSKIYYLRHKKGFYRKISNFLEQRMIAKALRLAGPSKTILDLPCGAGRFINTIMKSGAERIICADKSTDMLKVIKEFFSADILARIELMQTSIFNIDLPDNAVDNILCIRLLHHIHDEEYRNAIYKELQRVSRQTVCITYWVDGNYKSYLKYLRSKKNGESSRCLAKSRLEQELMSAGFSIIGKVDMLRPILYWRTYILKVDK